MNEIVNKFFLIGDKFMPEMHLKESGIVPVVHLPEKKERIEKFIQTGNTDFS